MTNSSKSEAFEELDVSINVKHAATFIDRLQITRAVRCVADAYGVTSGNVSIAVVGDAQMQILNKQYLQHDYTTDVLSFTYEESDNHIEGELILCADYARRGASEANWSAESELTLYVVHGMLHLMGLDDQTPEGREQMRAEERDLLIQLGVQDAEQHKEPANWSTE